MLSLCQPSLGWHRLPHSEKRPRGKECSINSWGLQLLSATVYSLLIARTRKDFKMSQAPVLFKLSYNEKPISFSTLFQPFCHWLRRKPQSGVNTPPTSLQTLANFPFSQRENKCCTESWQKAASRYEPATMLCFHYPPFYSSLLCGVNDNIFPFT